LLGSILTNTWTTIPVLLLSLKTGAFLFGINVSDIQREWNVFCADFYWEKLFQVSLYKIIIPAASGYLIISLCFGLLVYVMVYLIVHRVQFRKRE
jgi:uncharacterized protein (DUF2062 family)